MTCKPVHDGGRGGVEERLDGVDDGECLAPLSGSDQAPGNGGHFDDGGEVADGMTDGSEVGASGLFADGVEGTDCGGVVEVVQEGAQFGYAIQAVFGLCLEVLQVCECGKEGGGAEGYFADEMLFDGVCVVRELF